MTMTSAGNSNQQIVIPNKCACCAVEDGSSDVAVYSDNIGGIHYENDSKRKKAARYITFNVKICDKCIKAIKNKSVTASSIRLLPFVFLIMIILFSFYGAGNLLYILLGLGIIPFILGYKWIIGNDVRNSKKYIGFLVMKKSGEDFSYDAVFVNKEYEKLFKAANN